MKKTYPLFLSGLILIILINACKKDHLTSGISTGDSDQDTISPSATIIGTWRILKDSFYVAGNPQFYNVKDSVYFGTPADYYIFTPNGTLYIKEASTSDTIHYELLASNQVNLIFNTYITIQDSSGNDEQVNYKKTYTITTLTSSRLTMSSNISSDILTPEGYFANRLKLEK